MATVYACRTDAENNGEPCSRGTVTGWGAKARVSIRSVNASKGAALRSVKLRVFIISLALSLSRDLDRVLVCAVTTCRCRAVAELLAGASVPTLLPSLCISSENGSTKLRSIA